MTFKAAPADLSGGAPFRYAPDMCATSDERAESVPLRFPVDRARIAEFCRENHIRRFALFGSVLRDDFRPDSDVDVLVEFEPGHVPGLLRIARMERELSAIFSGRRVDLRTPADLSRYFRDEVLSTARIRTMLPDLVRVRHMLDAACEVPRMVV